MNRVWIGQVELSEGPSALGVSRPAQADDTAARLLVRIHGHVLGFVTLPLTGRPPTDDEVWDGVVSQLDEPLRQHLEADEIQFPTDALTASVSLNGACHAAFPGTGLPISVVVCTRERPEALRTCLVQLAALCYDEVEFVIIDNSPTTNASKDVFAAVVGDDTRFRYVVEPRAGLSIARNRGLAEARFARVAFTDDDVKVDRSWLRAIAAGFARDRLAGCVTGLVPPAELDSVAQQFFDRRYSWSARLEPRVYSLTQRDDSRLYPFSAGLFGTGANFAVDRDLLVGLGGFDEALGAGSPSGGGEDLDAFVRVILAGRSIVYEPSAVVWHSHRTGSRALRRQLFFYGSGLTAFLTKYLFDPRTAAEIVMRVPAGLKRGRGMWSAGEIGEPAPRSLVAAEVIGMLAGPIAFARGRWMARSRSTSR